MRDHDARLSTHHAMLELYNSKCESCYPSWASGKLGTVRDVQISPHRLCVFAEAVGRFRIFSVQRDPGSKITNNLNKNVKNTQKQKNVSPIMLAFDEKSKNAETTKSTI